jgi:hypothetical protein
MKQIYTVIFIVLALAALPGCFTITRTETDIYTITQRDTTIREDVKNVPGERDNGTIYPSTRTIDITRNYVERDSVINRYYPAFLRLGGIETAGFIAAGASSDGSGHGLFGLYDFITAKHPDRSKIFGGYMYRIAPYEVRLRAFEDSPNWTIGTAIYEQFILQRDSSASVDTDETLRGILPLYVRKRFFFREKPPYIMAVPFLGVGLVPSQYVNFGATLDVGSYGGFNLRAYLGYVAGTSLALQDPDKPDEYGVDFPYFGIGVSALDFVNKTEELFTEWKDHDHSAIEVSGLNIDLVYATSTGDGSTATQRDSVRNFPSGLILRLASATFPLPIADGNFFVGTSLFNLMWPSRTEVAFGFLPIRAGYRFRLIENDLNLEPFGEFTYHPSTAFHVGARASLKIYDWTQLNVVAGFISGSANLDVVTGLEELESINDFSTFYMGVGIGIGDVFHTVEEVRRK